MPALAKRPAFLPRIVPPIPSGAKARAGSSSVSAIGTGLIAALANRPQESPGHNIDQLAHDARNILSGLMLYSELLSAPGVLNPQHSHYAQELESIASSAARILETIIEASASPALPAASAVPLSAVPVTDAGEEVRRMQPLLASIAGPAIRLSVAAMPCAGRTTLAVENLTRILVNLVRNAADAMPASGHIRITAQYGDGLSFLDAFPGGAFAAPRSITLSISDDGPGIPEPLRGQVFDLGFTTRKASGWPTPRRRGLGLNIVRNLVEAAGGSVHLAPARSRGACFEITLPIDSPGDRTVTSGTCSTRANIAFSTDGREKGCIECQ